MQFESVEQWMIDDLDRKIKKQQQEMRKISGHEQKN